MSETIISAHGLQKAWRGQTVLDQVDLELKRGKVTVILGPSGTGKSTLLRVFAGLEPVDGGQVKSGDVILTDRQVKVPPEHRNIGLVFQDFSLFPHLTALGNVKFGLRSGSAKCREERAMEQLDAVQMADKANAYPHTLSGGEQQRVALARALAPKPDVILLDEAFSGLDAKLRGELRETALRALKLSGAAILCVTHDAEEAMFMADELALMVEGHIIQSGPPDQVYLNPGSLAAARLLGEINSWTGRATSGQLASPFGFFDAPHAGDGDKVTVYVRPEAVLPVPTPKGKFEIVESHPLGAQVALKISAPSGEIWLARIPIDEYMDSKVRVDLQFRSGLVTTI